MKLTTAPMEEGGVARRRQSPISYLVLSALVAVTVYTRPKKGLFSTDHGEELKRVWYFGLITALATGIGALPFMFIGSPGKTMLGACNALAAGMMGSASLGLLSQGIGDGSDTRHTLIGIVAGWGFIALTKKLFEDHEDSVAFASLSSADTKKTLLVIVVLFLHSFSEGVGIGVSFSGDGGLGVFISTSLAFHNVPEGLAVALVMVPKGISLLDTFLWAVFTSLPQPLMAIPSFLFVEAFKPLLPIGVRRFARLRPSQAGPPAALLWPRLCAG